MPRLLFTGSWPTPLDTRGAGAAEGWEEGARVSALYAPSPTCPNPMWDPSLPARSLSSILPEPLDSFSMETAFF